MVKMLGKQPQSPLWQQNQRKRLLRQKKYVLYVASLALSIYCSYYVGLFTCIFVLLLFIGYNFVNWDDLGGFWSRLFG